MKHVAKIDGFVIMAVKSERVFCMTEIKKENSGAVAISDDVLVVIAGTAALESEGVVSIIGSHPAENRKAARKQMARGINIQVSEGAVKAALSITARFGAKLHEVALDVQRKVKAEIENMTGLMVEEINVTVAAIVGEQKKA